MLAGLLLLLAGGAWTQELQTVTVRPGDTLWSISQRYLKDPRRWDEILKHNSLPSGDPTAALPGMRLRIPVELIQERMRAATLARKEGEVLHRERETADWRGARLRMDLFPDDGLRTLSRAEAVVTFPRGESLTLTPDSMVILSPPRRESDLKLLEGEVKTGRARVLTASALITPKGEGADYSAKVRSDLTTLVQVYAGEATVEAQGETVELKAGFASEVPQGRPPSAPIPLPELPSFGEAGSERAPRVVMEQGTLSVRVPPAKAAPEPERRRLGAVSVGKPIQGFRLQVAPDRGFERILVDRTYNVLESVNLQRLDLPPGELWYRLALVDLLGFESRYSEPRPLDRTAPLKAE